MIEKIYFGNTDGKDVYLYKMSNASSVSCEVIGYGAILRCLTVNGTDVVLGRDSLEEYLDNDGFFGATVGRHANRIRSAITRE